jgi:hypothetical protein
LTPDFAFLARHAAKSGTVMPSTVTLAGCYTACSLVRESSSAMVGNAWGKSEKKPKNHVRRTVLDEGCGETDAENPDRLKNPGKSYTGVI